MRCGWCRRPPADQLVCDADPCGLLVAELDELAAVMDEVDGDEQFNRWLNKQPTTNSEDWP